MYKYYLTNTNLFLHFCKALWHIQRVSGLPSVLFIWLCDPFVFSDCSLPFNTFSFLFIIIWLSLCPASKRPSAVQYNICIRHTHITHTHKAIMPAEDSNSICIKAGVVCLEIIY